MVSIMSHEPSASVAQVPRNTLSAIYSNPHQLKDSFKVIKRILSWKPDAVLQHLVPGCRSVHSRGSSQST